MIIVCAGPPCSGKSTVATQIAKVLGDRSPHISVDRLLTELIPESDRNVTDRTLALDEMHCRARNLSESSIDVIVDATYIRRKARQQLQQECDSIPMTIIELTVSPDVAVRRFQSRGNHDAIDQTPQSVREAATAYPWSGDLPSVMTFDSEAISADDIASRVVEMLRSKHCAAEEDFPQWVAMGRE